MQDHKLTIESGGQQILIVEDNEQLRSMLRLVLEDADYVVREAGNGREALKSYAETPADLILTDIVMPDSEGIEMIMKFKRAYPAVKIVAMSGGGQQSCDDYLDLASKLGANRTIAKPFSNSDILNLIREMLLSSK